jgi:fumarate hydratase class II
MNNFENSLFERTENDSFGEILIKANKSCFWGAQTERSKENFQIGTKRESLLKQTNDNNFFKREMINGEIIEALVLIKKIAAKTNFELGALNEEKAKMIIDACDEILNSNGKYDDQFPLVIWQTGSGTQTNMNINEVISNLCAYKNNMPLGLKKPIHPNDDVNKSQSSNDTFPTAMNIAIYIKANTRLLKSLEKLHAALNKKLEEFKNIIKIGRTHLQDATPLYLGQEFSGFASQIEYSIKRIKDALKGLKYLAQGGTAVGTGINSPKDFDKKFAENMSIETGFKFKTADNKFESLASHDNIVFFSGALNALAVSLMKIANDIRLLGSGPRCGLGELLLPENEPGSSIMPGKVNPTQCEALTMVCANVMGSHISCSIAGSSGHLQLNVYKPLIGYSVLRSINLLYSAIDSFVANCIDGIDVNIDQINKSLNNSLMLVTALNPHIGYDNAAKIAKLAYSENLTLKEACLKLGFLNEKEFDDIVIPKKMIES